MDKDAWNAGMVYIPQWTDPTWQDEGPRRQASAFPIRDNVLDRLRPALLPHDAVQQPTQYAKRFGIFPGRSDGRSCTSPTRTNMKLLFNADGTPGPTGKQLVDGLGTLASQANKRLDDLMIDARHDPSQLGDYSFTLKLYDELLIDEFWQSCLFKDMTMDELIAGDHVVMRDFASDLSGPLYPLLKRSKWDKAPFGQDNKGPTNIYFMDGKTLVYNPFNEDAVWHALQPALQLATKLIELDDPYFRALEDPSNWYDVDPGVDIRPQNERQHPMYKFEIRDDKSQSLGYKQGVTPTDVFNGANVTRRVLDKLVVFRFASPHENKAMDDKHIGIPLGGYTASAVIEGVDYPIKITLSSESIWALLSNRFSQTEKMMTSFALAVTIVHELMHAWRAAVVTWIVNPRLNGITIPQNITYCNTVYNQMFPPTAIDKRKMLEPSYKDDILSEVGHGFENHVLGRGVWPMVSGNYIHPIHLLYYTGVATRWPNGGGTIRKLFRQDWWDTVVKKFGSSAIREGPDNPSKAYYNLFRGLSAADIASMHIATREDRVWFITFINEHRAKGRNLIANYCMALLQDACNFEFIISACYSIACTWHDASIEISGRLQHLLMLVVEARAYFLYLDPFAAEPPERDVELVKLAYGAWKKLEKSTDKKFLDGLSKSLSGTFDHFTEQIYIQDSSVFELRLERAFQEITPLLDEDRRIQEHTICELYQLPTQFHQHYMDSLPGHCFIWIAKCHRMIQSLKSVTAVVRHLHSQMPLAESKWIPKMSNWINGFDTVLDLIPGNADPNAVARWQELLITVPMLRKTRRKPWERYYSAAKRATLNLTGNELAQMELFKQKFQDAMQLDYKIILPNVDRNEQGFAEHWAGLLDNMVGFERDQQKVMMIFGTAGLEHIKKKALRVVKTDDVNYAKIPEIVQHHKAVVVPKGKYKAQLNTALRKRDRIGAFLNQRRALKQEMRNQLAAQQGNTVGQGVQRGQGSAQPQPRSPPRSSPPPQPQTPHQSPQAEHESSPLPSTLSPQSASPQSPQPQPQSPPQHRNPTRRNLNRTSPYRRPRPQPQSSGQSLGSASGPPPNPTEPSPPPGNPPQITRPHVLNHPDPLTGPVTGSGSGNSADFSHFFQNGPPEFVSNPEELARQIDSTVNNHFLPAGRVHMPIPREYDIDGDIIIDLANETAEDRENMMDVDDDKYHDEVHAMVQETLNHHIIAHVEAIAGAMDWVPVAESNKEEEMRLGEEMRSKAANNPDADAMDVDVDVDADAKSDGDVEMACSHNFDYRPSTWF
ncbi:hypothetical protein PT974_02325 [Cladobotryum mycophilum]|uniref:Uncharacterized protein n=1 Tax=Cladobotryum mycophilum TaxID=491253 RepID=A0ABR0SZ07_9HYPO